jgi:hypothetical protein
VSGTDDGGILSRWSRRKALAREGKALPAEAVPVEPALRQAQGDRGEELPVRTEPAPVRVEPVEAPPAPTLDDVAQLTGQSDYTRFVEPDVDPQVKYAALKKLFSDPHFNVMDGLDVYIDDYGKPDPIPASMLRQLVQSRALGLFDDEDKEADAQHRQAVVPAERADPDAAAAASPENPANDPDPAVRLQPDDAAGPSGAGAGPEPDAGRER